MRLERILRARWIVHSFHREARSPYWYVRIRDLRTGASRKLSTRERTRRGAERFVEAWVEEESARDAGTPERAARVGPALDEWLETKSLRPSTLRVYRYDFEGLYKPVFGHLLVADVTRRDVEGFLRDLERVRGLAARTRRKHLTALRGFFRWAELSGYCRRDPTRGIRGPRGDEFSPLALDADEARRLVSACARAEVISLSGRRPSGDLQLAVLLGLLAGLRRGNVAGLRWGQVDLRRRAIVIPAREYKGRREHEAPISRELEGALRRRLREAPDPSSDGSVGASLGRNLEALRSACRRAEVPECRFHDLRHTHATWLAEEEPAAVVAACLGHYPRTVTDRYIHVRLRRKLEAVDRLPRLLSGGEPTAERDAAGAGPGRP